MCLGSLLNTTRKNKTLPLGKFIHDGINLLLQQFYLADSQMGRRIERGLRLVGGEIGADIEQIVLDALHHLLLVTFRKPGSQQPQMRAQFVDGAISLQAYAGLGDTLASDKAGLSLVAAFGIYFCYFHV